MITYGPRQQVTIVRGEFTGCKAFVRGKSATYDYNTRKHVALIQLDINVQGDTWRMQSVPKAHIKF